MGSNPGEAYTGFVFFCSVEDRMEGSNGRIKKCLICGLRSSRSKRSFESSSSNWNLEPSTIINVQYINLIER